MNTVWQWLLVFGGVWAAWLLYVEPHLSHYVINRWDDEQLRRIPASKTRH
ncbi:hypothetical protein SAMN02745157_1631 [Kaistia soli DSM 19436]|uniref:Uncharacterized protein n=1 Tax=Kaistia soli DSM 19436 TaxID=1122133 RepID=A0A1M4YVB1_9HYPH|nr:hypothetical protein [Kaistia soli]SHF09713.1 hypothetical protein SAMN02745157_1631 [Kaistia soli DSM 19436]